MNKQQIKELALSNGFKLKQQSNGEMNLNPYVYDFADALLAKANERVRELEQAILSNCYDDPSTSGKRLMALVSEQLRKEQE